MVNSAQIEIRVHPDVLLDPTKLDALLRESAPAQTANEPIRIIHRSIDARNRRVQVLLRALVGGDDLLDPATIQPTDLSLRDSEPVLIVGAGPAGLFCALELARQGQPSVVIERGKRVRDRRRDLAELTRHGQLDPESNYCFGEGGAGTFSDGKLYTRSKKRGDVEQVLRDFVAYGADSEILVSARPHIGTNRLPDVVMSMRTHLEEAGVQFVFGNRVTDLTTDAGKISGVRLGDGRVLSGTRVVLAPGHSARDVPQWLLAHGVRILLKPFALGVRIEHPQAWVDRQQYGDLAGHPALGAAPYRLVEKIGSRSVFSFCMCPGGFIAPASTTPGAQVVNGWSPSSRNGRFANSGFVVNVGTEQVAEQGLDASDPLAGVHFQEYFEEAAFRDGGGDYQGPAQRLDDFRAGRPSTSLVDCSYPRPLQIARLDLLLERLYSPLAAALDRLDDRMPGFAGPHALAIGVESRTSCPYRIDRDPETLSAFGVEGLYPCGEGAGYAGGIMSAALDGIRVARALA